ncbi:bromodomain-containing protein [Microcoleus sp. FACHB-68]|uniref:bromodomain-containing protein n=1 Tax=Microcoleus sp. FACHB-68 TaxID=2692826 RepID=UPI0016856808|nr:bromodomain-containing protein [Microcoleus sp. FACHB-68]MBD1936632.1 bromodomain-containing protein [Microcoleus sp. FACHB-68]
MDLKYKWKNGYKPSRDEAARNESLLDEGQFKSDKDRQLAEQEARKHLGVPVRTSDESASVLPHAAPPPE